MVEQLTSPPPRNYWNINEWCRLIAESVVRILDGKTNNVGSVTLDTDSLTTTLSDVRIGTNSRVILVAENADAGGEVGLYIDGYTTGACTIHHGSDSRTRTFRYVVVA